MILSISTAFLSVVAIVTGTLMVASLVQHDTVHVMTGFAALVLVPFCFARLTGWF